MSLDSDVLTEDKKVIKLFSVKPVYDVDKLFLIGKNIFLEPSVEETKYGFIVYGTPIDYNLPLFSINVFPKSEKLVVNIKGEGIPSRYRVEIEKIISENFC